MGTLAPIVLIPLKGLWDAPLTLTLYCFLLLQVCCCWGSCQGPRAGQEPSACAGDGAGLFQGGLERPGHLIFCREICFSPYMVLCNR